METHESHMIEGLGTDCKTFFFYGLGYNLRKPKYLGSKSKVPPNSSLLNKQSNYPVTVSMA